MVGSKVNRCNLLRVFENPCLFASGLFYSGTTVENKLHILGGALVSLYLVACGDAEQVGEPNENDAASDATSDVTSDATLDARDEAQNDTGDDGSDEDVAPLDVPSDSNEPDDTPGQDSETEPDAAPVDGLTLVNGLCRQIAEANCAALFNPECDCTVGGRGGYADEAECIDARISECFYADDIFVNGLDEGTITLMQANVEACVARIEAQASECRFDWERRAPECFLMLLDAASLGETCSFGAGVSCAEGAGSCQFDTTLCETAPSDGEPCVGASCAVGLYCQGGICSAPRDEGEPCASDIVCPLEMLCRDGTCQARAAIGQDCVLGNDCAFGALCDAGTCVVSEPVGTPCEGLPICGQGFECADNFGARTCGTGAPLNAECGRSFPCASGLYCTGGRCAALIEQDGPCGSSAECASGLACALGACVVLPGVGEDCLVGADAFCANGLGCDLEAGKCEIGGGDGEPCLPNYLSYACGEGFFCAIDADGAFCRPFAGIGQLCSEDTMCGPGRYCDYASSTCAERLIEEGQPCPFGPGCRDGLVCERRNGESICVVPPEDGQACAEVCAEGLLCSGIGGICSPTVCGI